MTHLPVLGAIREADTYAVRNEEAESTNSMITQLPVLWGRRGTDVNTLPNGRGDTLPNETDRMPELEDSALPGTRGDPRNRY